MPISQRILLGDARSVALIARLHSSNLKSNGVITIIVKPEIPTRAAPQTQFAQSYLELARVDVSLVGLNTFAGANQAFIVPLTPPYPVACRLYVQGFGGTFQDVLITSMSAELIVRS